MAITSAGIGSGLNVESIVSQLMAIESRPLDRLNSKKDAYNAQLSAYGQLSSAVATFQTAMSKLDTLSDFRLFKATSADETAFTATANSGAAVGTYDIQVDSLAQAHKIKSKVFSDTDTTLVGGGDLTFTVGTDSFTITGAGSLTLSELRDAVNNAADNVGVTASIISEDSSNNYLVFTSNETGNDYQITLSGTAKDVGNLETSDINTPGSLNAVIQVDGTFTVSRNSNSISDAITGVTLDLKSQTTSGVNLKIDRDIASVSDVVQGFVDSYNSLQDTIDGLRAGDLAGDNSLLNIESKLKSVFNTPPSGLTSSYQYLSEVGVAFEKTGKLSLDTTKLETAVNSDYTGLADLFANDNQGYAYRLKAAADDILATGGTIDARKGGINSSIDSTDSRIAREEFRLGLVETRLRAQYTALDTLLGTMSSMSSFLQQQLASLPGSSSK